ncbi:DUF6286 domain-containing protein [Streptomyces sp. NPDC057939]|uniref:DUF6286 domain-containing protein n=1 Tax=Streptomyces sp. NPDC057939 TaxID=3346284 RepID=UPI0036EB0753
MSASGRIRSTRRIPAALTALAVIGVAGLFLYDLVSVRAHRPGMRWRPELARWLEQHSPADTEVLVGGAIMVVLGALLLLFAVAPGLRGLLVMRTDTDPGRAGADADAEVDEGAGSGLRAGLGRKAAAMVLRDRAMEVAGVRSVRVKVSRSRVGVRATSHFRELDDVRADLDEVLAVGIEELGLARPPRPRVRVRR